MKYNQQTLIRAQQIESQYAYMPHAEAVRELALRIALTEEALEHAKCASRAQKKGNHDVSCLREPG